MSENILDIGIYEVLDVIPQFLLLMLDYSEPNIGYTTVSVACFTIGEKTTTSKLMVASSSNFLGLTLCNGCYLPNEFHSVLDNGCRLGTMWYSLLRNTPLDSHAYMKICISVFVSNPHNKGCRFCIFFLFYKENIGPFWSARFRISMHYHSSSLFCVAFNCVNIHGNDHVVGICFNLTNVWPIHLTCSLK